LGLRDADESENEILKTRSDAGAAKLVILDEADDDGNESGVAGGMQS